MIYAELYLIACIIFTSKNRDYFNFLYGTLNHLIDLELKYDQVFYELDSDVKDLVLSIIKFFVVCFLFITSPFWVSDAEL